MAEDGSPAGSMRERAGTDSWKLWLLVDAPRWLVAGGVLLAVVGAGLAVAALSPAAGALLGSGDTVDTLFQALLGATITGVTLVVTLNQVVLSQELGPLGAQREKLTDARAFRERVAAHLDRPTSPADPSALLDGLVTAAADAARRLEGGLRADAPASTRDRVEALVGDVTRDAEAAGVALSGARFGTFDVVSAALEFEYSWKLSTARRVVADEDHLTADGAAAAADLVELLELYAPAREHVKTL